MRRYRVIVTPEAQTGVRQAFEYIHERAPLSAARWLKGMYQKIDTLERFPERCTLARERAYLDETLHQLLFKSHRIVFLIDKKQHTVYVLYVRHVKRRAVGEVLGNDVG